MSSKNLCKYDEHKNEMHTGDLLLWRSNKWYMRLYRWLGKYEADHSSILLRLKEYEGLERRRFILESRIHGSVLNLLSKRLDEFDGEVWWCPLNDVCDCRRQKIGEEMLKLIGMPYNYQGVVEATFRRWSFGKLKMYAKRIAKRIAKGIALPMGLVQAVFCSEYCYIGYKGAGIVNNFPLTPPAPGDLRGLGIFDDYHVIKGV